MEVNRAKKKLKKDKKICDWIGLHKENTTMKKTQSCNLGTIVVTSNKKQQFEKEIMQTNWTRCDGLRGSGEEEIDTDAKKIAYRKPAFFDVKQLFDDYDLLTRIQCHKTTVCKTKSP